MLSRLSGALKWQRIGSARRSAIALLRHLIAAALMDLVGKRHGDGEGGEQDAACHQGNGDPSANHGQTSSLKSGGGPLGGLAHHLNQHAFGLGSDSGMRSKGNVLASHFRPRFVALKSRKKMKARLARDSFGGK